MPPENTAADLLRWHLSGAVADGGAQADPAASIGGYRSSSEVDPVGLRVESSLPGVRVLQAAGAHGLGVGSLTASGGESLRWTDPDAGDETTESIRIANGETRILEGAEPGRFLRVQRTSSAALRGSATLRILERVGAVWDDVADGERDAGDTEYRCLVVRCGTRGVVHQLRIWLGLVGTAGAVDASGYLASGAVTVTSKTSLADWPETGYVRNETTGEVLYYSSRTDAALAVAAAGREVWGTAAAGSEDDVLSPVPGFAVGLEAPSAQPDGTFATPADEDTDPGTVTFYTPTSETDPDVLEVPTLRPGEIYALWIERKVPAGAAAEPWARFAIEWSFIAVG